MIAIDRLSLTRISLLWQRASGGVQPGGTMEKGIAFMLGWLVIVDIEVPKASKSLQHDPRKEVSFYHEKVNKLIKEK